MNFNPVTLIEGCYYLLEDKSTMSLVYYSHIPTFFIAILIGGLIYFKNRKILLNKLLFSISLFFSLWLVIDLVTWIKPYNSVVTMFSWSFFGLLYGLICVSSIYFFHVYVDKNDISISKKIFLGLLLIPIILFTPTNYNINEFSSYACGAIENGYFTNYYNFLGFLTLFWILILAVLRYRKADDLSRKQIIYLSIGLCLFLLSFFTTGFLASFFYKQGGNLDFKIEQYGLFGMTFFMGVLGYMIVKFKAFNIKVFGAQALIVSLFILIASQFAFIQNPINRILTGITLFLVSVFGSNLIKSVRREIEQKEALSQANDEINERKNQLQRISDHLATANAKLKELDNAKSEFVSIVAHQLQSPPTTIKGYSTLLLDGTYGEMSSDQQDILHKIFNANEQQVAFVDDLLNVSRLESGRVSFDFENCQIQDICQEVMDNLFVKAKDKGLYLEFTKPNYPAPEVKVDKKKIREAISNLVDNAIKYTKKGGVNLSLKLCSAGEEKCIRGSHLRIMVSDTGIGILAEEMPRLFSKFSRGKDVKRLNAGGTGLGLYVVKMIVEGNRGKVWVESDGEGKGSRFIIELPV